MLLKTLIPALFLVAMPLSAQHKVVVTLKWTNNDGAFPTCSRNVHTWCLLGQTVTDTTVARAPHVLSNSVDSRASSYSYTYAYADFPSGTAHTYSVSAQYCGAVACTASAALSTAAANISIKNGNPPP